MKIHEYQAKALFRQFGVPVAKSYVVEDPDELGPVGNDLTPGVWVVKAQVHAGGRGKGSVQVDGKVVGKGVQVAPNPKVALDIADSILGGTLHTIQTGDRGKPVSRVLIEQGVDIESEFYLALIVDREHAGISIMASTEGGMEIEEVARTQPEKIHTFTVNPLIGYRSHIGRDLGVEMGLRPDLLVPFSAIVKKLYALFMEKDCSLIEVNPLVVTKQGQWLALDAKVTFDDNALYRNPDLIQLQDLSQEEPSEVEAAEARLSYVSLDGNIGCLVNGAGLAMATMDIIKELGGDPANFLDIGGTATTDNVARSFEIMLKDKVDGIFVNVFGGIVRCDVVARGLVEALGQVKLEIPLVVRLEGNQRDAGLKLLEDSGLPIITAKDMRDGARLIVEACKKPGKGN